MLSYQRSLLWADNEKLMEQAINYAPEKAFQAYLLRGMIYKLNEQLDLAEKDLLKSFSINEEDSYTVFHLGHLKQLQKDYKSAEEYYAYIPFTNVNYVAVVNNMGIILDIEGKTKDAIDFMEREKEKNIFVVPDYFFNTLAIFYYKEKNIDKAIENMKKTINLNPYNEHYYTQLMNLYKEKGNFIDFEYIALIGMKNIDDNISILNELISYYFSIEQYDKVEEVFLKYFKSNNDVGYSLLGNICAIKNNYKDALTCYTMAILLSRDKGLYYFKRAVVWYMLNNYNQAKKNVEKAEKYKFVVNDEFKQDLEKIK